MGWEDPTYIEDFNTSAPGGPLPTDPKSQGDDHIRSVKDAINASFPGTNGPWKTSSTFECAPGVTEQQVTTRGQIENGTVRNGAYGNISGATFTGVGVSSVNNDTTGKFVITFSDAATSTNNQALLIQLIHLGAPSQITTWTLQVSPTVMEVYIYDAANTPLSYPFSFHRKVY